MARPLKDGLDYFPHDVFSSSDEKIETLLLLYGSRGYAFYFLHLEYIYRTKDFELDISDAETKQILYQKLRINAEEYEQILKTCLKKGCFDVELFNRTGKLTSNGIKKRAAEITEKRDKMRLLYESRKMKKVSAAETPPETPQIKLNKIKLNNNSIHKNIIDYFFNRYFEKFKVKYVVNGGRDGQAVKKLLDSGLTEDYIKGLIDWYFSVDDEFIKNAGYTINKIQTFKPKYDTYTAKKSNYDAEVKL